MTPETWDKQVAGRVLAIIHHHPKGRDEFTVASEGERMPKLKDGNINVHAACEFYDLIKSSDGYAVAECWVGENGKLYKHGATK